MTTQLTVPELGENVEEAQVTRVLVKQGEHIESNQPIIEAETGKASAEIPASASGTIAAIKVKEGDTIHVGDVLLVLEDADDQEAAEGDDQEAAAERPDQEATPQDAQPPSQPAEPAAAATEPASPPNPATKSAPAPPPQPAMAAATRPDAAATQVAAAPSVRRFAREIGVDITKVSGSGPHDRVSMADVKQHARDHRPAATAPDAGGAALPDLARWGSTDHSSITAIRRSTAEQMQRSWRQIPHVTHCDQADITGLEATRHRLANEVEKAGGKLTLTPILIKIVAAALNKFPAFKATIDMTNGQIIARQYTHIGIAVDTDRGLLVPVIRDADRKSISAIAAEAVDLAEQARAGKLQLDQMQGGCFTITNLGSIGGSWFTPIINWPQSAILGVGRGFPQVVLDNGQCRNTMQLPLSLSYDHRLLDGAQAARFTRWIIQALEEPLRLNLT